MITTQAWASIKSYLSFLEWGNSMENAKLPLKLPDFDSYNWVMKHNASFIDIIKKENNLRLSIRQIFII